MGEGPHPGAALDDAYQSLLSALTFARRRVADAATSRKRIELRLGRMPDVARNQGRLAKLRAREAELARAEEALTAQSQRLQRQVDRFRIRKEAIKAKYTAAQAQLLANEAAAMLGGRDAAPDVPFPGADEAAESVSAAIAGLLGSARDLERDLRAFG
jgi:phage shock protein A